MYLSSFTFEQVLVWECFSFPGLREYEPVFCVKSYAGLWGILASVLPGWSLDAAGPKGWAKLQGLTFFTPFSMWWSPLEFEIISFPFIHTLFLASCLLHFQWLPRSVEAQWFETQVQNHVSAFQKMQQTHNSPASSGTGWVVWKEGWLLKFGFCVLSFMQRWTTFENSHTFPAPALTSPLPLLCFYS